MAQTLNSRMEIDHVVQVHVDGTISDPKELSAPEIVLNCDDDGQVSAQDDADMIKYARSQGWEVENGWSGQQGYRGPIMHASECIGGGLEIHIRETPGYWVACAARTSDDDESPGWVLLRHPSHVEKTDLLQRITRGRVVSNAGRSFTVEWEDGSKTTEHYDRNGKDWREASE